MPLLLPPLTSGISLQDIAQELGKRMGDLWLSTPTASGSTTALIDTALNQYFPNDIANSNWWVYGLTGVASANVGVERRVKSWAQASSTMSFYTGGGAWPTTITAAGTYEVRPRLPRERYVAAIKSAVRMLALNWYRTILDNSILTVDKQDLYTLSNSQAWAQVTQVEVQVNTDTAFTGYPYIDAMEYGLNWQAQRSVSAGGIELWQIQFAAQPPPGRLLQVWGQGYYPAPVADADIVPLAGQWFGPAFEFLMEWAQHDLHDWTSNKVPAGETTRYDKRSKDLRDWAEGLAKRMKQSHPNGRINVPGRGDGNLSPEFVDDIGYFGAFSGLH